VRFAGPALPRLVHRRLLRYRFGARWHRAAETQVRWADGNDRYKNQAEPPPRSCRQRTEVNVASNQANTAETENAIKRRRTAFAVIAWSSLPFVAAVNTLVAGEWLLAALFAGIVACALGSAVLATGTAGQQHIASVVLLLIAAAPFALQLARRLVFAPPARAFEIADSPLGYVLGTVIDSLFFAPPLVFAFGMWSRRALQTTGRA
jgi:hypothetical protein